LENWIENLNFPISVIYPPYPSAEVHEGFFLAFRSVKEQLWTSLDYFLDQYPGSPIVITGHSLGGALASIAVVEIKLTYSNPPDIVNLYTFGSPRVGDFPFASLVDSLVNDSFRLTHHEDIVVHLPPSDVYDYWHVAEEIFYPKENSTTFVVCDFSGEDPNGADSVPLALSVYDHLHYLGQEIDSDAC